MRPFGFVIYVHGEATKLGGPQLRNLVSSLINMGLKGTQEYIIKTEEIKGCRIQESMTQRN